MNPISMKRSRAGLLVWALGACLAALPPAAPAEDVDIFVTNNAAASTFDNPNVLIILDNTSNWARNDQGWPGGIKQGEAELQAIKTVVGELNDSINVGLMLFTDTGAGREGGYIRFPVMQMTDVNKVALQVLVQNIYNAFGSPSEKTSASANYSAVMFDAFKYFGGYTNPANVPSETAGTPVDATHFGPAVYNQRTDATLANVGGYTDATLATYAGPISSSNFCAKNFVIFIGNGFPNSDIGSPSPMDTYLSGIGGTTTQLAVPGFTTATTTNTADVGYTSACYASQAAAGTTDYTAQCASYTSCSVSGTSTNTLGSCPAGQSRYEVVGNATTAGTTTGPTDGTPTTATAPTTACYASGNPGAAATAVSAGTETGGLANPGSTHVVSGGTITDTTYTSTWSVNNTAASACADTYGAAGAPVTTTSGDTSACYLDKSNYVNSDSAGLICPSDTADTHYVCTYALKGNPNNGSNSDCPGSGASQQKRYAVTQTATPYPIIHNNKYTVTRTSTPHVSVTTGATTTQTVLGNSFACYSTTTPPTGNTSTEFPYSCPAGATCTVNYGGATAAAACPSGTARYLVQGNSTITQVVSNNTYAVPASNKQRMTDEWARYLYQTDVNSVSSKQNISTYTIDVFNTKQDADQTALLMSMARVGGGKYYAAKSQDQIVTAMKQIMSEIQAVNTVFASASLPVNATNRAQNENQVFIGMFRPDPAAQPRWYGNIKRYQLANFSGVIDLADVNGAQAVNLQTGFVSECSTSWWTSDSGTYWQSVPNNPPAQGTCTTGAFGQWSDSPDGPLVEKGAAAEVIRKGNNPTATDSSPTWAVNRTVKTESGGSLAAFTAANTGLAQTLVDFISGKDVNDENANGLTTTETRPSLHGDVIHSRPLPVNYATTANPSAGVTVFYGSNDGTLRAVNATNGKERWALIAPEFNSRLSRLSANSPIIKFPSQAAGIEPTPTRKDYFWDGSMGLYQNADNSEIWLFPSMRRGGRMIYGLDVTSVDSPTLLWKLGCPNLTNDTGCSAPGGTDVSGIGQTWSLPSVAFIKGYSTTEPVIVVGGGYEGGDNNCEDTNASTVAGCSSPQKGAKIYVIKARDGTILKTFNTTYSVASDVSMVDTDHDGYVDHAYVPDTRGNLYRLDFVDLGRSPREVGAADWAIYRVAYTAGADNLNGAPRKFFFPPALLYGGGRVYVALGSGDREHPLGGDYPFTDVINRFYVYLDTLATTPVYADAVNLDDTASMDNRTTDPGCDPTSQILASSSKKGWFMDLNQYGTGEQTVTSALILGGLVTFSTNRPIPPAAGSCTTTLGEARGYWVNLLNGSGGIGVGTTATCGGTRSAIFVGGGLPPSPVTGVVPVEGVARTVVIGAVQRDGSASAPIGGQKVVPAIQAVRKRVYWFKNVDN